MNEYPSSFRLSFSSETQFLKSLPYCALTVDVFSSLDKFALICSSSVRALVAFSSQDQWGVKWLRQRPCFHAGLPKWATHPKVKWRPYRPSKFLQAQILIVHLCSVLTVDLRVSTLLLKVIPELGHLARHLQPATSFRLPYRLSPTSFPSGRRKFEARRLEETLTVEFELWTS